MSKTFFFPIILLIILLMLLILIWTRKNRYDGEMSNVIVSKVVLQPNQIEDLYNRGTYFYGIDIYDKEGRIQGLLMLWENINIYYDKDGFVKEMTDEVLRTWLEQLRKGEK